MQAQHGAPAPCTCSSHVARELHGMPSGGLVAQVPDAPACSSQAENAPFSEQRQQRQQRQQQLIVAVVAREEAPCSTGQAGRAGGLSPVQQGV